MIDKIRVARSAIAVRLRWDADATKLEGYRYHLVAEGAEDAFIATLPGAGEMLLYTELFDTPDAAREYADQLGRELAHSGVTNMKITIDCHVFGRNEIAQIPPNRMVNYWANLPHGDMCTKQEYVILLNCPTCGQKLT